MRRFWSFVAAAALAIPLVGAGSGPASAVGQDVAVSVSPAAASGTVGDSVAVTVTVANLGSGTAESVEVDVYTGEASVVSVASPGAVCSAGFAAFCTLTGLAPGSSAVVTVVLRLESAGTAVVDAGVYSSGDVNVANNDASASITVLPVTPAITLATSTGRLRYGGDVELTALVTAGGVALPDARVSLLRQVAGAAATVVGSAWADETGTVTFTDEPTELSTYHARVEPDFDSGTAVSAPVQVQVGYAVSTEVSPVAIPPGGRITVTAKVAPAAPGATVLVEQRFGATAWRTVARRVLDSTGTVTVELGRLARVGDYALRVSAAPDSRLTAGAGQAKTVVTVTGAGRAKAWRPLSGSKARPTHWGSCTLRYSVNPRHMPEHGMSDLKEALRRVSIVNGTRFRYAGRTNAVPSYGYSRAGTNRFDVAWATPKESRGMIQPYVAGVGGGTWTGGRIYTGFVVMSAAFSRTAPGGFGAGQPHGDVLMHEVGHLMGLGHSPDPHAIMASGSPHPAAVWGAADLRGLRALGRASGCRG